MARSGLGLQIGPTQVAALGDRDNLVGRVVVDIRLNHLAEGVTDAVVAAVVGVGDVVTVVDRGPLGAVGSDGKPLAVAYAGFHLVWIAPVRVDGHDHGPWRGHRPVVGIGVGGAGDIEVDRAVRRNGDVLLAVHVVASGVLIREIPGDDRWGTRHGARIPVVAVDLVGLADVEDPMTGEAGERQPLGLGQPGQHGPVCGGSLGARAGYQFDDLALVGLAHQQFPVGAPGLHPGIRSPGP